MANRNAPETFTFEEWRTEFNELATDVGDIGNLPATINGNAVTDIVGSIQELESSLSSVMFPILAACACTTIILSNTNSTIVTRRIDV